MDWAAGPAAAFSLLGLCWEGRSGGVQGCSRSSCRRGLWTTPASAGAKCPGTACALRDSQAAAPISELGTGAGATSEWVAGDLVAPIAPIPPLPKTEAWQDHLPPALAPCPGRFSSDSSPSRRLRCCVLCSRCLPRARMRCRIRPAVGASVPLSEEQPLLLAPLARRRERGC